MGTESKGELEDAQKDEDLDVTELDRKLTGAIRYDNLATLNVRTMRENEELDPLLFVSEPITDHFINFPSG